MEDDRVYPEDRLPDESPHEQAIRIKYGLAICRACGWPVAHGVVDENRWCGTCRERLTGTDQP